MKASVRENAQHIPQSLFLSLPVSFSSGKIKKEKYFFVCLCLIITAAGHQTGSDVILPPRPSCCLLDTLRDTLGFSGIGEGHRAGRWWIDGVKNSSVKWDFSVSVCWWSAVRYNCESAERRNELPRDLIDPLISLLSKEHLLLPSLTCSLLLLYTCHE